MASRKQMPQYLKLRRSWLRGRKKKNGKKSSEYILTHIETIGEINYLVDDRNFVYSFDTNNPCFLGIKIDNTLKSLDNLGIKVC